MLITNETFVPTDITPHLLEYVKKGFDQENKILSTHIEELARMTGMKLTKTVVVECGALPLSFVNPNQFHNIGLILARAEAMRLQELMALADKAV
jgi:hypothetical protein